MKVLLLCRAPLDYKAGIPAYCKSLYLLCSGSSCGVLALSPSLDSVQRTLRRESYSSFFQEIVFPSAYIRKTLAFSLTYFLSIFRNSLSCEIIHVQHPDPFSELVAVLCSYLFRKRLIVTWHASINHKIPFPFKSIKKAFDIIVFSSAHKVFFFTETHLREFGAEYGRGLLSRFVISPMPCAPIRKPSSVILYSRSDSFRLIFVGRLVSYKGVDILLRSLDLVSSRIHLSIVGDGPDNSKLVEMASHLMLNDSCITIAFEGCVTDQKKAELLWSSHALVLPSISTSEALGIVQMEAMSCGLPIINTNLNNGVNEIAPHLVCALTSRPGSSRQLARNIDKLATDSSLYSRLSSNSLLRFYELQKSSSRQFYLSQLVDL